MSKQVKRNIRDSLFTYIFNDPPYLVDLYFQLSNELLSESEVIPLNMSDAIIQPDFYNDVAMATKDGRLLAIMEHQSSKDNNMAFRLGVYAFELLNKWAVMNSFDVHQKTKINFPEVILYVVYNGKADYSYTVKHEHFGDVSVCVRYYNIQFDKLQNKGTSSTLAGYAFLIKVYEEKKADGDTSAEAAKKAIDICVEHGYLADILKDGRCGHLIKARLTYEETVFRDGKEQGMKQEKLKIARNALRFKMGISDIKKLTGLTEAEIMDIDQKWNKLS